MNSPKQLGALLFTVTVLFGAGCGAGNQPIVESSPQEVADLKALRTYFDESGHDYTKLSAEGKKKFLDYAHGDTAKAQLIWDEMQNPSGRHSGTEQTGPGFQMGGPVGVGPASRQ